MSEMITVYRIENAKGEGPYGYEKPCGRRLANDHGRNGNRERPDIYQCCPYFQEKHFCACRSKPALAWWFDGHLDALESNGFKVAAYSVSRKCVLRGHKQLGFERTSTTPKRIIPWKDFLRVNPIEPK